MTYSYIVPPAVNELNWFVTAKNQGFTLKYVQERDTALEEGIELLKARDEGVDKCNQQMAELDELRIEMDEVKGRSRSTNVLDMLLVFYSLPT